MSTLEWSGKRYPALSGRTVLSPGAKALHREEANQKPKKVH